MASAAARPGRQAIGSYSRIWRRVSPPSPRTVRTPFIKDGLPTASRPRWRRTDLDRARFLGDPDFSKIPVADLITKSHARELISTVDRAKASSSVELGKDIVTAPQREEPADTTHFSVLDKGGMAVSNTYTL